VAQGQTTRVKNKKGKANRGGGQFDSELPLRGGAELTAVKNTQTREDRRETSQPVVYGSNGSSSKVRLEGKRDRISRQGNAKEGRNSEERFKGEKVKGLNLGSFKERRVSRRRRGGKRGISGEGGGFRKLIMRESSQKKN